MLTLANVLAHHGIAGDTTDTLTDNAREAGIILACHGCGTVTGIAAGEPESARRATRDSLDLTDWECCEGATLTVF